MLRRILIADDEESIRHVLVTLLEDRGYEARAVTDGEEALRELSLRDYDALLTDVRMPKLDGLALVRAAQSAEPQLTIIVMSAYGSHELAIEAMKAGAYDYLPKPFRPDEVLLVLRKAEERERLREDVSRLRREIAKAQGGAQLVAESAAMKEVVRVVQKVAAAPTTVLIQGESGTGKEVVARAIHASSARAERPFVAVNCGAIPGQLIESELFGHAKGAFTDAQKAKRGLFEEADSGTILLDEVGELPLSVQPSLLRVLQEGEVRRVGDARTARVDVRVIAATNRDLGEMVAAGRFREDLYYRLNVLPIVLPPLRERREDIPVLTDFFFRKFAKARGIETPAVSPAVRYAFSRYRWPGNVRELENSCERIVQTCTCGTVRAGCLGASMLFDASNGSTVPVAADLATPADATAISLDDRLREVESNLISWALKVSDGNKSRAAELLSIKRSTLGDRIARCGLTEPAAEEHDEAAPVTNPGESLAVSA